MKFIFSLLFFMQLAYSENNSLSCSKSNTFILLINGINTEEASVIAGTDELRDLFNEDLTRYDANGRILVDYSYNTSEGFLADTIQLIDQKLAGDKSIINIDRALYFFSPKLFIIKQGYDLFKEIQMDVLRNINTGKYNSVEDTKRIVEKIDAQFELGNKVIIVSHSQGNIYANYAYDGLRKKGRSSKFLNKYLGNLQVGSVAKKVKSLNNRVYTFEQDAPVNALRNYGDILEGEYYLILPDLCRIPGIGCHDFVNSYLSSLLPVRGPKQGESIQPVRTAKNIFLDNLEEVAWMLANNDPKCCEGRDGRFYTNTEILNGEEVKSNGGFVEFSSEVERKAYISNESMICGNSRLNGNISLRNTIVNDSILSSTHPSNQTIHKVEVQNSNISNTSFEGDIFVNCANISGGSYKDLVDSVLLGSNDNTCTSPTEFLDNTMSGKFSIRSSLRDATITANLGEYVEIFGSVIGDNARMSGDVKVHNSTVGVNANLTGNVNIAINSIVGNDSYMNGFIILRGSPVGDNAQLTGDVQLVDTSLGNNAAIAASVVYGIYILESTLLDNVELQGAFWLNWSDVKSGSKMYLNAHSNTYGAVIQYSTIWGVQLAGAISSENHQFTSNTSGNLYCDGSCVPFFSKGIKFHSPYIW